MGTKARREKTVPRPCLVPYPFGQNIPPHNPTDYFKRKTDCQQSTPTKAPVAKKRLLKTPDPQIGSSVIAFDKDKQRKVFSVNFRIWARSFKHMRREIDNLDQYLSIDNFPLSGLQSKLFIKPTLEMSSKETNCLVRQICGKNWHAAAITK